MIPGLSLTKREREREIERSPNKDDLGKKWKTLTGSLTEAAGELGAVPCSRREEGLGPSSSDVIQLDGMSAAV